MMRIIRKALKELYGSGNSLVSSIDIMLKKYNRHCAYEIVCNIEDAMKKDPKNMDPLLAVYSHDSVAKVINYYDGLPGDVDSDIVSEVIGIICNVALIHGGETAIKVAELLGKKDGKELYKSYRNGEFGKTELIELLVNTAQKKLKLL